jgi:hypothetical protein
MGTVTRPTTSRIMGEIRLITKLRLRGVVDMPILRDGMISADFVHWNKRNSLGAVPFGSPPLSDVLQTPSW